MIQVNEHHDGDFVEKLKVEDVLAGVGLLVENESGVELVDDDGHGELWANIVFEESWQKNVQETSGDVQWILEKWQATLA